MAIRACLFDFSGTIFRAEPTVSWLRGALAEAGIAAPADVTAHYARLLETAGALPGGRAPAEPPDALAGLWAGRNTSGEAHRAAYTALARRAALPWPELYDVLYDRHMTPRAWAPYPDTVRVLTALRERGVRIGLVSNIGWDLRPVLRAHGVAGLVDTVVLSYEEGVDKPDPRIFRTACARLGVPEHETLMVGDDIEADGGSVAAGCAFLPVTHLPVAERPDGLRAVPDLVGGRSGTMAVWPTRSTPRPST